jgi:nucleotide-binding universal stress UspA family protein
MAPAPAAASIDSSMPTLEKTRVYRTILVGCDGSTHEADAIALAQQLRDPEHGRIILANVFPYFRGLSEPAMALGYLDWLREQADIVVERAEAHVTYGVPCERQTIASPSAAAGLNDLAETVNADLIVLGRSHQRRVGELAGRMTVQRLLHGAPCAVAVAAPGQTVRFAVSPSLCVAYDASPESDFALEVAYGIAGELSASVLLCSVLDPTVFASGFAGGTEIGFDTARQDAARAALEDAAGRAPAGVAVEQRLVLSTPVHTALAEAAAGADLLVAGSRGFGALRRAIAGSTSSGLLRNGEIPVLVTPRTTMQHVSLPGAAITAATDR